MNRSIPQAFFEVAGKDPQRVAIVCGDRSMTYGALAESANAVARTLRRIGVVRGDRVGLYLPRSPEAIAAIIGILKLGAAYVPFDPSFPLAALRQIYQDCKPSLLLISAGAVESEKFWDGPAFDIDAALDPPPGGSSDDDIPDLMADACYVMYTSGSTGQPKGVQVPHRAVLRLVRDNPFVTLDANETLLQLAPLSFDASTFEIWGALLNGGRLAILANVHPSLTDIADAISRHKVTTAWLTAGLFHLMVDHQLAALRPLRQLLAGGDVLSPSHVGAALRELPDCRLINGYGPTENTTFSCCYTIPRDIDLRVPVSIGKPIEQTEIYVLDADLQPVAAGEIGELFVAGAGLAGGYLGQPALTQERFIANPFDPRPGARMYRTGDRVSQRPDGNLDFLGRVDRQIKINGKRVELDSVEAALRRTGLIADAAVTTLQHDGQRSIAAYVTALPGVRLDRYLLRSTVRKELPDYMVPGSIDVLDALPLTPAGKIDRRRLPLPSQTNPIDAVPEPTANALEAQLLLHWRSVLGHNNIGLDDNFFDVGGTSLQLIRLHALLSDELPIALTVLDLFQRPRIRSLAAHLARQSSVRKPLMDANERARMRRAAVKTGSAESRARCS